MEVLELFAGRVGLACRSTHRDMWRLVCTHDYPEVLTSAARTLQHCCHALLPTSAADSSYARREIKEMIEALVVVVDTYGDAANHDMPATDLSSPPSSSSSCHPSTNNGYPLDTSTLVTSHSTSCPSPPPQCRDFLAELQIAFFALFEGDEDQVCKPLGAIVDRNTFIEVIYTNHGKVATPRSASAPAERVPPQEALLDTAASGGHPREPQCVSGLTAADITALEEPIATNSLCFHEHLNKLVEDVTAAAHASCAT